MVRARLAILIAGLLTGCVASSPEVLMSKQDTGSLVINDLKFKIGDRWTYRNFQSETGIVNRTWTEVVVGVDINRVTIQRIDRIPSDSQDLPPIKQIINLGENMYNFPLFVGKQWKCDNIYNGKVIGRSEYKVISQERINTPNGEMETLKISNAFSANGKWYSQLMWLAPAVRNFVKIQYTRNSGSYQATELTGFQIS